jgi:hypothetical protein
MSQFITSVPLERRIRLLIAFYIFALLFWGITTFPLEWEVDLLNAIVSHPALNLASLFPPLVEWIGRVNVALHETYRAYPFLAYGTDWLAFAHIIIGLLFIGPLRDPVKNVWVIEWGMLCCVLVIPLAIFMSLVRGIPFGWTLVDCAFGVLGIIPLYFTRKYILQLQSLK